MARLWTLGSGEYLTSSVEVLNPRNSAGTAAIWFRPSAIGTQITLLSQLDGSGTGRTWLTVTAAGALLSSLGNEFNSGGAAAANQWQHGCIKWALPDGSGATTLRLLLDGVEVASGAITMESNSGALVVGANKLGGGGFLGRLGQVTLWDAELSANEVKMLAARSAPVRVQANSVRLYAPIVGQAPEPDYGGEAKNLTLTGSPAVADAPPVQPWFGYDAGWQGAFTEAAAGGVTGDAALTLPALTASAAGSVVVQGAASPDLPLLTISATGTVAVQGDAALTLPLLTVEASGGAPALVGNASLTLPSLTASAAGTVQVQGAATLTLPALTLAASGAVPVTGAAALTLPLLVIDATGAVSVTGSGALTLPLLTITATGVDSANLPVPPYRAVLSIGTRASVTLAIDE